MLTPQFASARGDDTTVARVEETLDRSSLEIKGFLSAYVGTAFPFGSLIKATA